MPSRLEVHPRPTLSSLQLLNQPLDHITIPPPIVRRAHIQIKWLKVNLLLSALRLKGIKRRSVPMTVPEVASLGRVHRVAGLVLLRPVLILCEA